MSTSYPFGADHATTTQEPDAARAPPKHRVRGRSESLGRVIQWPDTAGPEA